MDKKLVSVAADNIISPLGLSSEANYSAVKKGKSMLKRHEGLWGLNTPFVASLLDHTEITRIFDEQCKPGCYTFFEKTAILSIQAALNRCDVDVTSSKTLIIISTTKGNVDLLRENKECFPKNREMSGDAARAIAEYFDNPNTSLVVSNACTSGVCAQIEAYRQINIGNFDSVIVCGAEELSPFIVSGFQSLKAVSDRECRPFDEDRTGINLGDAAATIIYKKENSDTIGKGKWYISNGAIRNDGFHISAPSPKGEGCYKALMSILKDEDISDIAFINAHGTATMFNDEMESAAIDRAGLSNIPVNSLKGYFGHTMGAAGVVESIISMHAANDGLVIGTRGFGNLGVSRKINVCAETTATDKRTFIKMLSGFGGCNAAIIFKQA